MDIIIVGKPGNTSRTVRLSDRRTQTVLLVAGLGSLMAMGAMGAAFGLFVAGPAAARVELDQARSMLAEQSVQLADVKRAVGRDMDALAIRLGQLQAETIRLNALGQRLAKAGQLEEGEFDFSLAPAVGGPSRPLALAKPRIEQLGGALGELEQSMAAQSLNLRMLEAMLFNREVERTLLPAGIPVRVGYMSSGFGRRTDPFTGRAEFHSGVDFAGPKGSDVLAVGGGAVSFSGTKPGYGRVVEIDHGNGYMTRYAHNHKNVVDVGDPVRPGDVVAKMGATGRASGVHVHLEVWREGRVVNPTEYLASIR